MKIFGIGLNKTGTTTLGRCLSTLGFHHLSCRRDLLEKWRKGEHDAVWQQIEPFESFDDWPYPFMYKEAFERYGSDAKFILTMRKTPEIWLRSLEKHSLRTTPIYHCRKLAYGFDYPFGHEQEHLAFYTRHNAEVQQFFAERAPDQLLVVCWEEGHGWDELCPFLGIETPDLPFPHENATVNNTYLRKFMVREIANRTLARMGYHKASAIA
ncbi:MAG: sulfotransferase family protein [Hyphomicrobiaceae bacterium]